MQIYKNGLVHEKENVFVIIKILEKFLGAAIRTSSRLICKMKEEQLSKNIKYIVLRHNNNMLTTSGFSYYLENITLPTIINRDELQVQFDEYFTNYYTNTSFDLLYNLNEPKSCVYIIHIKDDYYKFGETDNIKKRLKAHEKEFKYEKLIGIFGCPHKTASQEVEKKIKFI